MKEDSDKSVDPIEPKTDEKVRKRTKSKDDCDANYNKMFKTNQECDDSTKDEEISTKDKSIENTSMKVDIFFDNDKSQNLNVENSLDVDSVKENSNNDESEYNSKTYMKNDGEYSTSDEESDSSSSNGEY